MKPTIFIQANKRFAHNQWLKEASSATLRYFSDQYQQPPTPEISLSVPHPDGEHQNEIIEITFADGEKWNGTFADLQKVIQFGTQVLELDPDHGE